MQTVPQRLVADRRHRAARRRTTAVTLLAARLVAEELGKTLAVPIVGPVQTAQRRQQVQRQAPGAGHRMQVPVETATLARPVQGQPGAPARGLARPAQIQAGEAEENQDQGASGGDLLAVVAQRQETVQAQHQVEETLAARLREQFAAVRIEVTRRPPALTRFRRKEHPRGVIAVQLQPQADHLLLAGRLDLRHQHRWRQHAAVPHLDPQHFGVQRAHQFTLERIGGTGHAHQRQDQAGADTEQPMQLKQDFLQHGETPDTGDDRNGCHCGAILFENNLHWCQKLGLLPFIYTGKRTGCASVEARHIRVQWPRWHARHPARG
ncbi:hypothetical protein D9M68_590600 [compost metagenome]